MASSARARREASSSARASGVMSVTTMVQPPSGSGSEVTSITWPLPRIRRAVAGCERSALALPGDEGGAIGAGELVARRHQVEQGGEADAGLHMVRRQGEQFGEARIGEQQRAGRAERRQPKLQRRQRGGGLGQRAFRIGAGGDQRGDLHRADHVAAVGQRRAVQIEGAAVERAAAQPAGAGPVGREHRGHLRLRVAGAVHAAMGRGAHRILHRRARQDAVRRQVQRVVEGRVHVDDAPVRDRRCRRRPAAPPAPDRPRSSTAPPRARRDAAAQCSCFGHDRQRAPQRVQQHQRGGQHQDRIGLVGGGKAGGNHQQQRRDAQRRTARRWSARARQAAAAPSSGDGVAKPSGDGAGGRPGAVSVASSRWSNCTAAMFSVRLRRNGVSLRVAVRHELAVHQREGVVVEARMGAGDEAAGHDGQRHQRAAGDGREAPRGRLRPAAPAAGRSTVSPVHTIAA